ncbi:MAG TPA: heme exporter protein CcmD [Stellaceae bacterium]|nr:heme exporter protein CcmD [Stellaceae bacterium]
MSTELAQFLNMGGYALFVWPSFAATFLMLALMLGISLHGYRRNRRLLDHLLTLRHR